MAHPLDFLPADHPLRSARTDVPLRPAEPGDAGRLAELLEGGALAAKEDPSDVGAYRAALADIAATPGNDVLVAELDGRVVGMCQLFVVRQVQHRGGWCGEIESVHVDATVRGRGVGTALIAAAVAAAGRRSCFRVQLTSSLARSEAHRWYRHLGFQPTHTGFKLALTADAGRQP